MRHNGEAAAMALLCSHHAIDVLQRLIADSKHYPGRDAVNLVHRRRNAELLKINRKGWCAFKEITTWYDRYSHATLFSLAAQLMLTGSNELVLGSEFDEGKRDQYGKELDLRVSAMARLSDVSMPVEQVVVSAQGRGLVR